MTRLHLVALEKIRSELDERDLALVQTLQTLRVATARQLERIHFDGPTRLASARRCRARLERLTRLRVLARLDRRVGGVRAGSASFVYHLDVVGQHLVKGSGSRRRRPVAPGPAFLAHALEISEIRAQLAELDREGTIAVDSFEAEPHCWRNHLGASGVRQVLKPDAYVELRPARAEGYVDSFFIECDRGTEWLPTIRRKLDAYTFYYQSGIEQQAHGVFPEVAFIVPNERRKEMLVDACSRRDAEYWKLFRVILRSETKRLFSGEFS